MFVSSKLSQVLRTNVREMGTVAARKYGLPEAVLEYNAAKAVVDKPSAGYVNVAISASQVTTEDVRAIRGLSYANKLKGVAGVNGIGKIVEVGNDVTGIAKGDHVYVHSTGTWSDNILAPANAVYKLNTEDANVALIPSLTSAWALLHNFVPLKAGDSVIQLNGDASPTGVAVTALGKALGVNVINVNSVEVHSPEMIEKSKSLNIKLAITGSAGSAVRDLNKHLAKNGDVVYYSGEIQPVLSEDNEISITLTNQIFENKSLWGFDYTNWVKANDSNFKTALEQVTSLLNSKKISLSPIKSFPQNEYKNALNTVSTSNSFVVLKN